MISTKLTYIGLAIALGYGLAGCSSSDNPTTQTEAGAGGGSNTGGSSGTGGGSSGAGGGTAGAGGGTAGAGGGATDGGGTPTCDAYCTAIMANCTGGDGSKDGGAPDGTKTHQQYTSKDNCMKVCLTFPVGKAGDSSGDTLGCRLTHANLAPTDPALHCPHAGPGGDNTCGAPCDSYCRIVKTYCAGEDAGIYSSDAQCKARCTATPSTQRFNIGIQEANQQACLLYHAQEAPLNPVDHCLGDLKPYDSGTMGSVTCQ